MKKIILILILVLMVVQSNHVVFASPLEQSSGPALALPEIHIQSGETATVELNFQANGNNISSLIFSLDIDSSHLAFDPTDRDNNGIPDSIVLDIPPQFTASLSYDPKDEDGEIDVMIADVFPPLSTLPDGNLITISIQSINSEKAAKSQILFSLDPPISFGDSTGKSVSGKLTNGIVWIEALSTLQPTATSKPLALTKTPVSSNQIILTPTIEVLDANQGADQNKPNGEPIVETTLIATSTVETAINNKLSVESTAIPEQVNNPPGGDQKIQDDHSQNVKSPSAVRWFIGVLLIFIVFLGSLLVLNKKKK